MASNVLTGAYRVFWRSSPLTSAQIDDALDNTKRYLPADGWKQIFTNGDVSLRFQRETINLTTNQEGIRKILFSSFDTVEVEIPIADVSYENVVSLIGINPVDTSTTQNVKKLSGSYFGVDATQNTFSLLIYHLSYDPDNNTNTPKLGIGSDPMAIVLFSVVNVSGVELAYTPDAQQIIRVTFRAVSVDGITQKGVVGAIGSFVATPNP